MRGRFETPDFLVVHQPLFGAARDAMDAGIAAPGIDATHIGVQGNRLAIEEGEVTPAQLATLHDALDNPLPSDLELSLTAQYDNEQLLRRARLLVSSVQLALAEQYAGQPLTSLTAVEYIHALAAVTPERLSVRFATTGTVPPVGLERTTFGGARAYGEAAVYFASYADEPLDRDLYMMVVDGSVVEAHTPYAIGNQDFALRCYERLPHHAEQVIHLLAGGFRDAARLDEALGGLDGAYLPDPDESPGVKEVFMAELRGHCLKAFHDRHAADQLQPLPPDLDIVRGLTRRLRQLER